MISKVSIVNHNSILGKNCIIEPFTIIGHPESWKSTDYINSGYDNIEDFFIKADHSLVFIGENSVIRSGSVIYENVNIGINFQCGSNVIIRSLCKIGDNVFVKNNSEIMRNVIIGNNCRIAGIIGDFTKIGNNVFSYGMIGHKQNNGITEEERKKAPSIGNNVLIGRGSIILGQITIGNNVVIGANAFVDKNVPDNVKVLGNNKMYKL
jgi:acetyltransferase-like isoleucine patch superfamily enzyme